MTLDELKDEFMRALIRAGYITNGETWRKDGVAYLMIESHETGLVVSGRVFVDDGLSYTFVSAPMMCRYERKAFTQELADKFLSILLEDVVSLAKAGELPIYERSGAI